MDNLESQRTTNVYQPTGLSFSMSKYQRKCLTAYLDYINNWLTVGRFAEAYGLTRLGALNVLSYGETVNELFPEKIKLCP